MTKYHKEIGFLPCHIGECKVLLSDLKFRKIRFSFHALQSLKDEREDVKIGQFLRDYVLNFDDIFEIVVYDGIIQRMGFRVNFNEKDIVFIISRDKLIITLWTNEKSDLHYTLNKNNYAFIS
jgi:hypothetical protein